MSPSIYIGLLWPPENIFILDAYSLPLWNTIILLSSGVTVTYAHKACIIGERYLLIDGLLYTIFYGILFTFIQGFEYCTTMYSWNDGIYGSLFFILTGFHGIHVIIGTIFLLICLFRQIEYHFTKTHFIGFEISVLYWHLVDAIWIFLK